MIACRPSFLFVAVACASLAAAAAHARPTRDGFVCDTDKHHIVIDRVADRGALRYRAWNKPHPVDGKPDVEVLGGTETTGGTDPCVSTDWSFKRGNIEYSVSDSAACTDGKPPRGA
ncbi:MULTISPECIES: hypothetical protein [Burkholderia]|uniref:Lipoprotein n=1 Tax=Burkholderia cepacia TaxID=292 RepID=A0AA89C836_BURCE|nr:MULTISPECIES: hypothetical protein [Burkholderia]KGB91927.1 hypothetical protein DM43_734 [Burkholderia cepacia]